MRALCCSILVRTPGGLRRWQLLQQFRRPPDRRQRAFQLMRQGMCILFDISFAFQLQTHALQRLRQLRQFPAAHFGQRRVFSLRHPVGITHQTAYGTVNPPDERRPISSAIPSSNAPAYKMRRSLRLITGAMVLLGLPTVSTPIMRPCSITGAATYITELFSSCGSLRVLRAPYWPRSVR